MRFALRAKVGLSTLLVLVAAASLAQQHQALTPDRKTEFEVDGDTVAILRDSFGVPHVYAATLRGLFYGNGYAIAQDRLWQMERYRRDAQGRLAEIEGRQALARDREVRRAGYTTDQLREMFARMEPDQRVIFEAYRDGVNAWIEQATARNTLPEGFRKAGIQPAPWDVTDTVSIGVLMARRFGGGVGPGEARNLRILNRLKQKFGEQPARRIFNDLFWRNDPRAPSTLSEQDMAKPPLEPEGAGGRRLETERELIEAQFEDPILASVEDRLGMREILEYAAANQLPTKLGSYAWVIAPKRSLTGNALLVGGPQMGFTTPQIAHEIHLNGAGFNVIGMGFAGIPAVLIGHNQDVAWTTTSGVADLADLFAEKLDPRDKRRYLFRGRARDMECRVETIAVRDSEPEQLEVCRTQHGPVVEWDEKAGVAYAASASFDGHELDTIRAIMGFNRSRTVQEFGTWTGSIWPSHNFFAADRRGNIGYWHCGKQPIRAPGFDPRLPLPGTGAAEWRGMKAAEHMPHVINPERGYIVNWNNKPAPWFDNGEAPVWGEIFRIHRIQALIEQHPRLAPEHMREIAADISRHDLNAAYFKPRILDAVERLKSDDAGVRLAASWLRTWNDKAEDGSVGKAIFDAWLAAVRDRIFGEEFGGIADPAALRQLLQPSLILHVLDGEKSGVPPRYDYLKGRTADEVIVAALRDAVAELRKQSAEPHGWGFRVPMETGFRPLPPVPKSNRGTYIQIVELSYPLRGVSILPPGQSEDPRSPHYSDQLTMSSWWQFKPMVTERERLENPKQ